MKLLLPPMVNRDDYYIEPVSGDLDESIWNKINTKTKPVGSLGKLEELAFKISRIQHTLKPKLINPVIALFAGDHGIAKSGLVNPYPQEVTQQMVLNFLNEGAAINVFSKQQDIDVKVVDAGVNYDFQDQAGLIDAKIGMGTLDYRHGKAMEIDTCEEAMLKGAQVVSEFVESGTNVIGFGEMGISNTSSAALIMSAACGFPIDECVGRGTGADDAFLKQKVDTLKKVVEFHRLTTDTSLHHILAAYGGFEIAQMVGGMLKAASEGLVILVDGFISSVAYLVASKVNSSVRDFAIFTHVSDEHGHARLLDFLGVVPLLSLGMRLGEGTGCAAAYPLLKMSVAFMNEMSSFESAEISQKSSE